MTEPEHRPRRQVWGYQPRIFLNYASEDRRRVDRLYKRLADEQFRPWRDTRDIGGGRECDDYIRRYLWKSDFFLACLSKISADKPGYVQDEREEALALQKYCQANEQYLIPIRLESCDIPPLLQPFKAIDLFRKDGFTQLCEAIRQGLDERFLPLRPRPEQQSILIQGIVVFPLIPRLGVRVKALLYTGDDVTFVHPNTFKVLEDQLSIRLPAYEHTTFYDGKRHPMSELRFMFPGGTLFEAERGFAIPEIWPFPEDHEVRLGSDITQQLSLQFTRDGTLQVKRHRSLAS